MTMMQINEGILGPVLPKASSYLHPTIGNILTYHYLSTDILKITSGQD